MKLNLLLAIMVLSTLIIVCGCDGETSPEADTASGEDGNRLNMSILVGKTAIPKVAVYVNGSRNINRVIPGSAVVIAVWDDGRIVWSKEPIEGGPPYWVGKVELSKLERFFDELEQRGLYKNPTPKQLHFGPDSAFTVIAITYGARQIKMTSWHELFEASSETLVGTARGIYYIEDGRSREEILAEQPEEYKRFRSTWSEIRSLLKGLIPEKGQIVKDLVFLPQEE